RPFLLAVVWIAGLAGCGPIVLTVDDAIVASDARRMNCVAYVEREPIWGLRHNVHSTQVEFMQGTQPVGRAAMNDLGRAEVMGPFDPAGRAKLRATATEPGTPLSASATIFAWKRDQPIIVLDIDHTLVRTDFDKLILRDVDEYSTPLIGSHKAMESIS